MAMYKLIYSVIYSSIADPPTRTYATSVVLVEVAVEMCYNSCHMERSWRPGASHSRIYAPPIFQQPFNINMHTLLMNVHVFRGRFTARGACMASPPPDHMGQSWRPDTFSQPHVCSSSFLSQKPRVQEIKKTRSWELGQPKKSRCWLTVFSVCCHGMLC